MFCGAFLYHLTVALCTPFRAHYVYFTAHAAKYVAKDFLGKGAAGVNENG